ncbi:MAG: hypothetical protein HRU06_10760 [Oceanospirillaceae bacterium]|nr:hypothetical protein [Oceanospirillaceae bacterium]
MTESEEKNARDFSARPAKEQQEFIENTWCEHCMKENLGLTDPNEYEQGGTVYIEGKCRQCSNIVLTELTEEEF